MTSSERRSLMAERGYSVVRLQVEATPYASARPNRRSALARNSANLAGRGTSSLLCMAIDGGATRRLLTSARRHKPMFPSCVRLSDSESEPECLVHLLTSDSRIFGRPTFTDYGRKYGLNQGTIIIRTVSVIAAPPEAEPAITTTVSPDLARPESFICVTAKSQRSPMSVAGER